MRVSGCLAIVVASIALILVAGFCSLTSFSFAQQTVVNLNAAGMAVNDPLVTLRCAITSRCERINARAGVPPLNAPLLELTPLTTVMSTAPPEIRAAKPVAIAESPAATSISPTAVPTTAPIAVLPRITDPRQIQILLLGIDQRSATDDSGPFRTDTMMLININPAQKSVGVLSLPRDLWVEIPDFGGARINQANFIGDGNAYPGGGGPALAMETVAANFGVRVDKYLLVNFDVFTTIVDTLAPNGVPVTVSEWIDDPDYPDDRYGTIHVKFEPGEQRMDAETLLQYARTRATDGGDFDRARRQQQALDAVRAEVLSAGGMINFLSQAFTLWDALQGNYRTNLELNDIVALGDLMGEIKREDIHYRVIDNLYAFPGLSPQGEQVLYPDFASIRDLILDTFYAQAELSQAEMKARADEENPLVYVFNGTQVVGLAGDTRDWLLAKGVRVDEIGNDVTNARALTEIREYGRYHETAKYLAALMGLPEDRILRSGDGLIAEGVLVALGRDAVEIIGG
ncbi:MAG: LCP family protein [Chloroflexota bacterium]|nr:LCP family protein [Chloroflexota bacterium]